MMWVDSGEWRQAGKRPFAEHTPFLSVSYTKEGTKEIFVYKLPVLPLRVCVCLCVW